MGATVAAIRYVHNSPAILTVLVRTALVLFFSSSLFALLPSVAKSVDGRAIGYGLLLGCFGAGAIGGALLIQTLRARFSTEMIISAGVVMLGTAILAITQLHELSTLAIVVLVSGAAWVLFISLINALVQNLAPDWVRARVLAIFTLVYMGRKPCSHPIDGVDVLPTSGPTSRPVVTEASYIEAREHRKESMAAQVLLQQLLLQKTPSPPRGDIV